MPPLRFALHFSPVVAATVTVPVGPFTPGDSAIVGVTPKLSVTICPATDELVMCELITVVLFTLLMVIKLDGATVS